MAAQRELWEFSIHVCWQDTGTEQQFKGTVDTPPGLTAADLLNNLLEDISRKHQRRGFTHRGFTATFRG
ncbi:hypothetical protein XF35_43000 [Streptomyces platensis subsp. clarensis]|uniref:Uncharacterized protein n=1 Tax=Streptomyces showdoensis TaxID=68268 RepID=A0A2P2GTN7_STREW|nr:hypothetical protein [Streptomyces showdoensis]KKZ74852.1 hypothetical protein VO63_05215 [Streptomyces showdoensis]MCW7991779.1 hypothetical protein [Streptomyces platensis subsp. clarensis]